MCRKGTRGQAKQTVISAAGRGRTRVKNWSSHCFSSRDGQEPRRNVNELRTKARTHTPTHTHTHSQCAFAWWVLFGPIKGLNRPPCKLHILGNLSLPSPLPVPFACCTGRMHLSSSLVSFWITYNTCVCVCKSNLGQGFDYVCVCVCESSLCVGMWMWFGSSLQGPRSSARWERVCKCYCDDDDDSLLWRWNWWYLHARGITHLTVNEWQWSRQLTWKSCKHLAKWQVN